MKNTNKMLMMASCTLLLVMRTSIIPMQSYAESGNNDENKKHKDNKSKTSAGSHSDKKSANQDTNQDNVCYRGNETCTQTNEGQELIGKDNDADGFTDQSNNFPLFTPSTTSPSPLPSPSPTPTPKTCEECFRSVLTPDEITAVEDDFDLPLADICERVEGGINEIGLITHLLEDGIGIEKVAELIKCLKGIGVVFGR
jgi:hypothetical protein